MKVILNQDVPNLGELGDIKEVAPGYARNYLFPRNLAFLFTQKTKALFEKRTSEIEALKAAKRNDSASLREKLEAEEIAITVPAGQNGKLYGAVTNATIYDELLKKGIEIDRKKIEVPGRSIKSVGNYSEVFERSLGEKTKLGMTRGPNNLWNAGGLLYAPPVR